MAVYSAEEKVLWDYPALYPCSAPPNVKIRNRFVLGKQCTESFTWMPSASGRCQMLGVVEKIFPLKDNLNSPKTWAHLFSCLELSFK